jgi:hypothetical protein
MFSYESVRRRTQRFPRLKVIWRSLYCCMGLYQGIRYRPCSVACGDCPLFGFTYFGEKWFRRRDPNAHVEFESTSVKAVLGLIYRRLHVRPPAFGVSSHSPTAYQIGPAKPSDAVAPEQNLARQFWPHLEKDSKSWSIAS